MTRWHHQLNGPEFEQTPGDSEGQGNLACCSLWGRKELDMTEQLNSNKCQQTKKPQHLDLNSVINQLTYVALYNLQLQKTHSIQMYMKRLPKSIMCLPRKQVSANFKSLK